MMHFSPTHLAHKYYITRQTPRPQGSRPRVGYKSICTLYIQKMALVGINIMFQQPLISTSTRFQAFWGRVGVGCREGTICTFIQISIYTGHQEYWQTYPLQLSTLIPISYEFGRRWEGVQPLAQSNLSHWTSSTLADLFSPPPDPTILLAMNLRRRLRLLAEASKSIFVKHLRS